MNYYPRHTGDYLSDAGHLTLLEHGVYVRLMDVYYTREAPIPVALAHRLVGARTEEERQAVDTVLAEFFVLEGDVWRQKRCDRDIEAFQKRQEAARVNGEKGGRPRKLENPAETNQVSKQKPKKTQPVFPENPEVTEPLDIANPDRTSAKANQEPKPNTESDDSGGKPPSAYDQVHEVLSGVCELLGWPDPVPKDVRSHLKEDSHLRLLIDEFGTDNAVAMYTFAYKEWQGNCTWPAVFRQRHSIVDKMTAGAMTTDREEVRDEAVRLLEEAGVA